MELDRRLKDETRVLVYPLAFPAMGSVSYYYLADRIAAAHPDLIVWQTSLVHLSDLWRRDYARGQYSGWLEWRRVPEAFLLPLADVGLTVDRLLLYKLTTSLGGTSLWRRLRTEQSRVDKWRGALEQGLEAQITCRPEKMFRRQTGLNFKSRSMATGHLRPRYVAAVESTRYGDALTGLDPDNAALRLFEATLGHFSEAGISVVVYLNPINVEHLTRLEMDTAELERSVALYADAAGRQGAILVDLHDRFPDEYFSDERGHFLRDEDVDAPGVLIREISDPIASELRRRSRR